MLFCMDLSVSLVGYTTNKIYRGEIWDNDGIPGSSKKTALDQKVSACTGSPRTPCINVANHHLSMAGARMAVFFEGSARRCFHTTLNWGTRVSNCPC